MPLLTASYLSRNGWTQRAVDPVTFRRDLPGRPGCWLEARVTDIGTWALEYVRCGHHEPFRTAVATDDVERFVSLALAGKL